MIEHHSGRMQIVCECGFSQHNTYTADEFDVMVADARDEGFVIAKVSGSKGGRIWTHTCETCARPGRKQGRLL